MAIRFKNPFRRAAMLRRSSNRLQSRASRYQSGGMTRQAAFDRAWNDRKLYRKNRSSSLRLVLIGAIAFLAYKKIPAVKSAVDKIISKK